MKGHSGGINSVSFSPDGTKVVTGSDDNLAIIWNVKTGEIIGEPLKCHSDAINSVSFSPDGTRIVTGSQDKLAIIWDVKTGAIIG